MLSDAAARFPILAVSRMQEHIISNASILNREAVVLIDESQIGNSTGVVLRIAAQLSSPISTAIGGLDDRSCHTCRPSDIGRYEVNAL